jgi:hypothetical protein
MEMKRPPQPGPISIHSQTAYHCNLLLEVAAQTAQRCRERAATQIDRSGAEEKTPDALSCILLAAAAAEAFINELGHTLNAHAKSEGERCNPRVASAAWLLRQIEESRGQTMFKFESALVALTDKPPARGQAPLQDLSILFDLRNALMHMKRPETLGVSPEAESTPMPKCIDTLVNRKLTRRLPKGHRTYWVISLMTCRIAEWACSTTMEACDVLARQVPAKAIADRYLSLIRSACQG